MNKVLQTCYPCFDASSKKLSLFLFIYIYNWEGQTTYETPVFYGIYIIFIVEVEF